MLSPRQIFEDNIRPADMLLKVYRLLEHDTPNTEDGVLRTLRDLVKAEQDEGLMVIYNEVFLGRLKNSETRTLRIGAFLSPPIESSCSLTNTDDFNPSTAARSDSISVRLA